MSLNRRSRLLALLRSYRDARETLQRGESGGVHYPTSRSLSMPAAWHAGDYSALEHNLALVRRMAPRHYWMLCERFLRSERQPRELVHRDGRYFVPARKIERGRVVAIIAGQSLPRNEEVVIAKSLVEMDQRHVRGVLVMALVERWNERVEPRMVERAVDFLLAMMPREIRLPAEVLVGAKGAA